MDRSKTSVAFAALLLATALFYLLTLSQGTVWADDWGLYLAHARNLATGRAYADTGYIFNPLHPKLGPANYPPVFPLVLAPVYAAFGLSLQAFKVENCLVLLGILAATFALFRRHLGDRTTLLLVGLIAFNPWFWWFRNLIYADWVGMCLVYLALLRADRGTDSVGRGVVAGLLCYLAYATRAAGAAVAVAVVAHVVYRERRLTPGPRGRPIGRLVRRLIPIILSCALPLAAHTLFLRNPVGYYLNNSQTAANAADSGGGRAFTAVRLLVYPFYDFFRVSADALNLSRLCGAVLFVLTMVLVIYYYRRRISAGDLKVFDLFLPVHLLTFPLGYNWQRNFFPIAPIVFYQVLTAIGEWTAARRWSFQRTRASFGIFLGVLATSYLLFYATPSARQLSFDAQNVAAPDGAALFDFVRTHTPPDATFVFRRPRVLAVMTDRRSSIYPEGAFGPHFLSYLRAIKTNYLIAGTVFRDEPPELMSLAETNPAAFHEVFRNGSFRVFQVTQN